MRSKQGNNVLKYIAFIDWWYLIYNVDCVRAAYTHTLQAHHCAEWITFERKLYLTVKGDDAFIWSQGRSQKRDLFEIPTPKLPAPRPRG